MTDQSGTPSTAYWCSANGAWYIAPCSHAGCMVRRRRKDVSDEELHRG